MKTGISVSFSLTPDSARESFSRLRLLGYECADLQTFVNTETEWFSASDREKHWKEIGDIARDCGLSLS